MAEIFHGGQLDAAIAQFGGKNKDWLDLSTGINPNPYKVGNVSAHAWQRLPDRDAEAKLFKVAREYYGVTSAGKIIAANGTQALIELLPQVLGKSKVAIVSPTYGEHANAWSKQGHDVEMCCELDGIPGADVGVVVNPNNPDCRVHSQASLADLAQKVKLLVIDEAFCDPQPENSIVPAMPDNAVVLKSFGKFFGLAGLRLGFAICNTELAETLQARIGPWAVSGPALEIGAQALCNTEWVEKTRKSLHIMSKELAGVLETTGLHVEGVNPLFVHASHADTEGVYHELAKAHILVRPFPDRLGYLRFGLPKDNGELERLKRVLAGIGHG